MGQETMLHTDSLKGHDEKLRKYRDVLQIGSRCTDDYLFIMDFQRRECWFYGAIDREFALRDKGLPTVTEEEIFSIVHPADREMLSAVFSRLYRGEQTEVDVNFRWMNRHHQAVWVNLRGEVLQDEEGQPAAMQGRVSTEVLRRLYDAMTGLWNRQKLQQDLQQRLERGEGGYLLLLDIENLAAINLQHGRTYGDTLLRDTAALLEAFPSVVNAYYIDHNYFAAILEAWCNEDVIPVYNYMQSGMRERCSFLAGAVPIDANVFLSADSMLDAARLISSNARQKTKEKIEFYSAAEIEEKTQELKLCEELKHSISHGFAGFSLVYQPQVRSGSYQLYAVEALLRYRSGARGPIGPTTFIPLLEHSHLISAVGLWVLETALAQCSIWRKRVPNLHMSVNFSIVQFEDPFLGERVLELLERHGLPGSALTIEITESLRLQEDEYFRNTIQLLKSRGISLSIDDFGAGYSNLGYLKMLNVDEVKIDRCFISNLTASSYNHRLISSIIDFAKATRLRVCCEGVEATEELAVLEAMGPDLLQGFLFDRPCTPKEIEQNYLDSSAAAFQQRTAFCRQLYHYKLRNRVIRFDPTDILRESNVGLWLIRINEKEHIYEMHADATMARLMAIESTCSPQECYEHWFSRIHKDYLDYVRQNVDLMIRINKVVQLQYPWNHPTLGWITVRCNGRRTLDADGMIVLEGYHRSIDNIEGA